MTTGICICCGRKRTLQAKAPASMLVDSHVQARTTKMCSACYNATRALWKTIAPFITRASLQIRRIDKSIKIRIRDCCLKSDDPSGIRESVLEKASQWQLLSQIGYSNSSNLSLSNQQLVESTNMKLSDEDLKFLSKLNQAIDFGSIQWISMKSDYESIYSKTWNSTVVRNHLEKIAPNTYCMFKISNRFLVCMMENKDRTIEKLLTTIEELKKGEGSLRDEQEEKILENTINMRSISNSIDRLTEELLGIKEQIMLSQEQQDITWTAQAVSARKLDCYDMNKRLCSGFTPTEDTICWLLSGNQLLGGQEHIRATRVGSSNNFRAFGSKTTTCQLFINDNTDCCQVCRRIRKVLSKRAKRAKDSDKEGSIANRKTSFTNTDCLRDAKIRALEEKIQESNEKIRKLEEHRRMQIDIYFESEKAKTLDPLVLDSHKRIYLMFCEALMKTKDLPFLFKFIEDQLYNYLQESPFARRYSNEMKIFWKGLRHITGPRAIDYLRGAGNTGGFPVLNRLNVNLFVPHNETMDIFEERGYYGHPDRQRLARINKAIDDHVQKTNCAHFIICYDGVRIIPGFDLCRSLDLVLGGYEAMTTVEYMEKSTTELDLQEGNEMLQFHLQSLDGNCTLRLAHYVLPSISKSGNVWFISKILKKLASLLYRNGTCMIIASASDGDLGSTLLEIVMNSWNMNNYQIPWFHFFDFSHLLKSLRNALFLRSLQPGKAMFSMKTIVDLCSTNSSLDMIRDVDLNPGDIMKLSPVLKITDSSVVSALKSLPLSESNSQLDLDTAKEIGNYLSMIRSLYDCMMDPNQPIEEKCRILYGKYDEKESMRDDSLMNYLIKWDAREDTRCKLSSVTLYHTCATIDSLFKISRYLENENVDYQLMTSVLSTLCTELSFAIMRGVLPIFTASQYSMLAGRVEWDEQLQNCDPDKRGFSLVTDKRSPSKYYNKMEATFDKPMLVNEPKPKRVKNRISQLADVSMALDLQKKLADQHDRKGEHKLRSHAKTHDRALLMCCDFDGCKQAKPYVKKSWLERHFQVDHNLSFEDAESRTKFIRAECIKRMIHSRAHERAMNARNKSSEGREISLADQEELYEEFIEEFGQDRDNSFSDEDICRLDKIPFSTLKGEDIFVISDEMVRQADMMSDLSLYNSLSSQSNDTPDNTQDGEDPVVVCLLDIETPSGYIFPDGGIIQIAVKHELEDEIRSSDIDPRPFVTPIVSNAPKGWSPFSIACHNITPVRVTGKAPLLEKTLPALFEYITVQKRYKAVVGAFFSGFDRSRLDSAARELVPDFGDYDITWVDVAKLIGREMVKDADGRVYAVAKKLEVIYQMRTKKSSEGSHDATFDVKMCDELLLQKFGTQSNVKKELVKLSTERKRDYCSCTTGCLDCGCALQGCHDRCGCFDCKNTVSSKKHEKIDTSGFTVDVIPSLQKQDLKSILFENSVPKSEWLSASKQTLVKLVRTALKMQYEEFRPRLKDLNCDHVRRLKNEELRSYMKEADLSSVKLSVAEMKYRLLSYLGIAHSSDKELSDRALSKRNEKQRLKEKVKKKKDENQTNVGYDNSKTHVSSKKRKVENTQIIQKEAKKKKMS